MFFILATCGTVIAWNGARPWNPIAGQVIKKLWTPWFSYSFRRNPPLDSAL